MFANIKSNGILKEVFSHLKMVHILKIIKNNKNLQNNLGITKNIYENNSDLSKLELQKFQKNTVFLMLEKAENLKMLA